MVIGPGNQSTLSCLTTAECFGPHLDIVEVHPLSKCVV